MRLGPGGSGAPRTPRRSGAETEVQAASVNAAQDSALARCRRGACRCKFTRCQGFHRQRVDLLSHSIAQSRVHPLVSPHTCQAFEVARDDGGEEVPAIAFHLERDAVEPGSNEGSDVGGGGIAHERIIGGAGRLAPMPVLHDWTPGRWGARLCQRVGRWRRVVLRTVVFRRADRGRCRGSRVWRDHLCRRLGTSHPHHRRRRRLPVTSGHLWRSPWCALCLLD